VQVYAISKQGNANDSPFYSRTFKSGETNEVRLFGLGAEDVYEVEGDIKKGTLIRIIGGNDKDSIVDNTAGGVHIYDDNNNFLKTKILYVFKCCQN